MSSVPSLTPWSYFYDQFHCTINEAKSIREIAVMTGKTPEERVALRSLVLQEEPLCPERTAEGFITATVDVHHKQKATADNFWDRANLQALCRPHHSWHTQRGE